MFNQIVKDLRLEAGLTQKELADKMGVHQSKISNFETGFIEPDIAALVKLGDIFDVSLDYLCGRSENQAIAEYFSPVSLDAEQRELLNIYNKLTKNNKLTVNGYVAGLAASQNVK